MLQECEFMRTLVEELGQQIVRILGDKVTQNQIDELLADLNDFITEYDIKDLATHDYVADRISDHNSINTSHSDLRTSIANLVAKNLIEDLSWDNNGLFSWIDSSGTNQSANIANYIAQSYIDFDNNTNQLEITRPDGSKKSVDLTALIPVFTGGSTLTISTNINSSGVINSSIIGGSITATMLTAAVQNNLTLASTALQSVPAASGTVRGGVRVVWAAGTGLLDIRTD